MGHIQVLQLLNLKTGVFNQFRDVPVQVAAASQLSPSRRYPVLPFTRGVVWGFSVFQEQQVATGLEYPLHLQQGRVPVRNGAQGEGKQNGIDRVVLDRKSVV